MSDAPAFVRRRPVAIAFYTVAALAAVFEIGVLWLALNPNPHPDYRAYYIDKTTTCLNQPRVGPYVLGDTISFTSENYGPGKEMRVCGWEGPAGDGTHAVGTTSRLRLGFKAVQAPLLLSLEITAVDKGPSASQRVVLYGNGIRFGLVEIAKGTTQTVEAVVPREVLDANPGVLDLTFGYADAFRVNPGDSEGRMRSIKLKSLRLGPMA